MFISGGRNLNNIVFSRKVLFFVCLFILTFLLSCKSSQASEVEKSFHAREWKAIDRIISEKVDSMDPRDISLATNALWLQGRWGEALPLLLKNRDNLPESLKPYQDMMIILGYERTGDRESARQRAEVALENAPEILRYYTVYALARVNGSETAGEWYQKMYVFAGNQDQKKIALEGLVSTGIADKSQCMELLDIDPSHRGAFTLLSAMEGIKEDISFYYYSGIYNYKAGKYREAANELARIQMDHSRFAKARYYQGLAHSRLKEDQKSLEAWSLATHRSGWYARTSAERIARLAGKFPAEAKAVLTELADTASDDVRPVALYNLSNLFEGDQGSAFKNRLLVEYPANDYSCQLYWEEGWDDWLEGKTEGALSIWGKGLSVGCTGDWRSRFLFWMARGYGKLDDADKSREYMKTLAAEDPLSHYAILAWADNVPELARELPESIRSEPSQLEQWGFIPYAKLELEENKTVSSVIRYARLSSWMGDNYSSYLAALTIKGSMTALKEGIPLVYLQLLYPKPFEENVMSAAAELKVDPYLIWAVMRRESAYNPMAVSSAGATGLMQLMPPTARDEAGRLNIEGYSLFDPVSNIRLGTSHLAWLASRIEPLPWILAAYNAGSGNLNRWLNSCSDFPAPEFMEYIPFEETSTYVKKVMANYRMYKLIYGEKTEGVIKES